MAEKLNDASAFAIAEAGFGCHPKARTAIGSPMEDERMFGSFHIGLGTNLVFGGDLRSRWHVDATCAAASATLDGVALARDGEFLV